MRYKQRKNEKTQTFDLSYFTGKSYFDDNGLQNYLIFLPVFKYFQIFISTIGKMLRRKSKGLLEESITTPAISVNRFAPKFTHILNFKIAVKFEGNCLKQNKLSFTQRNVVNVLLINLIPGHVI